MHSPDPSATIGGPKPNRSRAQKRASSGSCPASSISLPLEEDPRPS